MTETIANFSWLDWVLLISITLSALWGMSRGLLWELMSIALWGGAALGAALGGTPLANSGLLAQQIDHMPTRLLFTHISLFVLLVGCGALLRMIVHRAGQRSFLRPVDHILGMVFGALRGMLLVMFAAIFLPLQNHEWWRESQLIQYSRNYQEGVCQLLEQLIGGTYCEPLQTIYATQPASSTSAIPAFAHPVPAPTASAISVPSIPALAVSVPAPFALSLSALATSAAAASVPATLIPATPIPAPSAITSPTPTPPVPAPPASTAHGATSLLA